MRNLLFHGGTEQIPRATKLRFEMTNFKLTYYSSLAILVKSRHDGQG